MIDTERLKLTNWQLFWHYSIVPFIMIVPIMSTYSIYQIEITGTYTGVRSTQELINSSWPFVIAAIIFTIIQYRRLNFKKVNVKLSPEKFKEVVSNAATKRDWSIDKLTQNQAVATTGLNGGSWGERITILRTNDYVLINSICDPDSITSVASWGANRKNIKAFRNSI
jgi:hypothetical protein